MHYLDAIHQYFPHQYLNKANPSISSPVNKLRYMVGGWFLALIFLLTNQDLLRS